MAEIQVELERHYPSIGRCIYCQTELPPDALSDEHMIPFFLGGLSVMDHASCRRCAVITGQIETHMANRVFFMVRHKHGIQSRRKKKRPTHFNFTFLTPLGKEQRAIPIKDAPFFMVLPVYPLPGILLGKEPTAGIVPDTTTSWASRDFNELLQRAMRPGDRGYSAPIQYDVVKFARFIAKIALSSAVAMLGYDPRNSPLAGIVLGSDPNVGHYIGAEGDPPGPPTTSFHPPAGPMDRNRIGFQNVTNGAHTLTLCEIQLLVKQGGPIKYMAIIGEAMPGDLLENRAFRLVQNPVQPDS